LAQIEKLKRSRVVRALVAYGIVAFALLQVIEPIMHGLHLPDATLTWSVVALAVGLPIVVLATVLIELADARTATDRLSAAVWKVPRKPASIAVVALAAALFALAAMTLSRRAASTGRPRLIQLTFEGGIEEFPAWSPDGRQVLYAAQVGAVRKLFRRDLGGGAAVQVTRGVYDDLQPCWSPDAARIVFLRAREAGHKLQPSDPFGVWDGADVWSLELRTGKEERLVENAANPALSPDGARIAVDAQWAGPRRLWLVDASGHNPVQASTDSSDEVQHLAPRWSPDGKKIVFQNAQRTKYDVRVLDLEKKTLVTVTDDFPADVRPVWAPSGRFIYFTSDRGGNYNIWRVPVGDRGAPRGALEQVTTGPGQDVDPALSPDGRLLAFTTLRQNADLWRLPVSPQTGLPTGEPVPLVATTREDSRGAWSPDGKLVALNSDRGGEMNIWVQPVDGGPARQVTTGSGGDYQPNWSPDGTRIAFFSSRGGRPGIFAVDVSTGALTTLAAGSFIAGAPFWAPDGTHIAFQSDKSGRTELWVMHADGSDQRQLTNVGVGGHFVRWTASGDAVVFRRVGAAPTVMSVATAGGEPITFAPGVKGGSHISFSPDHERIMDVVGHRVLWCSPVAGGEPHKVYEFVDPAVRIDYPVWSPDGKWVLFDRTHPEGGDVWILQVEE